MSRRAPLIIVSGPSGVGKSTLVDRVLANTNLPLRRAITATTRAPRPGEQDNVHYHFWTRQQFVDALNHGEMIESAEVHGKDFYGTPRNEVDPHCENGTGVILVIDVQGAGQVRLRYPENHLSVFICPPSIEELRKRLQGRGEPDESQARRLQTANSEMERRGEFDIQLHNADLAATTLALEGIIRGEFHKRGF